MRSKKKNSVKRPKGVYKLTGTTRFSKRGTKLYYRRKSSKLRFGPVLQHDDTPIYGAPIPMPPIKPEKEELHVEHGG